MDSKDKRIADLREVRDLKIKVEGLTAERARVCAALEIEDGDDPAEAIEAAWEAAAHRLEEVETRADDAERERDALRAEVEATRSRWCAEVGDLHRVRDDLETRAERAEAGRREDALRFADWLRSKGDTPAQLLETAAAARFYVTHGREQGAASERLRKAAGSFVLGNPIAEAIAEAIEAENEADALAEPAFDALESGDVEGAKKVIAQMEEDERLRGTQAYARLSAMVSLETMEVDGSDSEALTAWRDWAAKMADIGDGDAQDLEDEALRISAADRWEGEAQIWKDAHGHADAAFKSAAAQRDFYRTRLHAEIEAHSLRASAAKGNDATE